MFTTEELDLIIEALLSREVQARDVSNHDYGDVFAELRVKAVGLSRASAAEGVDA